jgi:hypothetical protein
MLYTPLPPEDIWGPLMGDVDSVHWDRHADRLCLARLGPRGERRLERLFSTNPRDYLDPRFQPGTLL